MEVYFFYVLAGIVVGALASLIFVTLNQTWKKVSFSAIISAVIFAVLNNLNSYIKSYGLKEEVNLSLITASVFYLLSFLLTFSLIFILVCYLIKTQKGKVKIRVLDIILNYSDMLKIYYESRQKEVDREINIEYLEKKSSQLDNWELTLREKSKTLEEQSRNALKISLPLNGEYLITNEFLSVIPVHIESYSRFYHEMRKLTKIFIDEWKSGTNRKDYLTAYFVALCININTVLFQVNSNIVRSHIRVLKGDYYIRYISVTGGQKIEKTMTKIPKDEGLIHYSAENNCSLVKSLNPTLHYKGNNDRQWKDYISFAVTEFKEKETPVLSFGVSIENYQLHGAVLKLLNLLKFEQLITEHLERINQKCNILETVKEITEGMSDESN